MGEMAASQTVSIGFGNVVMRGKIVAVVGPDSLPIRRLKQTATESGKLVDATMGKKTRSVIVMDSDHVILSAISLDTIVGRIEG